MADDEKVIRIEGQLDEGKAPEPTAGDKLRDQESATDAVRDSEFEDLLKKLTGVEKPPSGEGPATGDESLLPGVEPAPADSAPLPGSAPPVPPGGEPPVTPVDAVPAGEAGGGLAATLEPLAMKAIGVTAVFTGLAASALALEHVLGSIFEGLSSDWNDLSGAIAGAEGRREAELTFARLRTEQQVGPNVAAVTEARTGVDEEVIEIKATLIEMIAPALVDLLEISKVIFVIIKDILKVLNLILKPLYYIEAFFKSYLFKIVTWVLNKLGLWEDEDKPEDALANEFARLLQRPIAETNKDKIGNTFPKPHAGRIYNKSTD